MTSPVPGPTARTGPPAVRIPDRLWVPALLSAVLALLFVGALLVRADGDPSLLVHAAPPWTSADGSRDSLTVQGADQGFDGQFFYRLGVAPWSTDSTVDGVTFDLPALRNARWGYGALAFVASGGDPDLVPWSLIAVNVVAAAALGGLAGGLARASGRHAATGMLLVLWPGFAYSLSLDTSELVAATLLLGGLLSARHRRWSAAALLLAAASITRDTTVVVPVGLAAAGAWGLIASRRAGTERQMLDLAALAAGSAAVIVFATWQLVQRARFGELPLTSSGDNNLSAPLGGLVDLLRHALPPSNGEDVFRVLCALGIVGLIGAAAWWWRRSTAPLGERLAWLPAVAVVFLLNAYLWSGATAFMRAATEAGLLSILIILGSSRRRLVGLTGVGLAGLWVLTAAAQLSKLG